MGDGTCFGQGVLLAGAFAFGVIYPAPLHDSLVKGPIIKKRIFTTVVLFTTDNSIHHRLFLEIKQDG